MKKLGKVKVLAIASLSAVVLAIGSLAVAQTVKTGKSDGQGRRGAWQGQGRRGSFGGDRLFARLNLTDDQKAKVKQIRQSFMESNKPLFDQLKSKRQELRQASE